MFILDFPTVAMSTCFMVHAGQSVYVTWWTLSLHETIPVEILEFHRHRPILEVLSKDSSNLQIQTNY